MRTLWQTVQSRVGKVEQALLLAALVMVIAVPIAVAEPQGSANLATTPTTTITTTLVSTSTVINGQTISVVVGITSSGTVIITISADGHTITITSANGFVLGATITVNGLPQGNVTLIGVLFSGPTYGPMQTDGAVAASGVAAATTITATSVVGPDGTVAIPASLQGVRLSSLTIKTGVAAPPAQVPAQVPSKLPAKLPATGNGGMAS